MILLILASFLHAAVGYGTVVEPIELDVRTYMTNITFSFGGHVWHSDTERYNDAIDALGDNFKLVRWQVIPRCDGSRCQGQAPTGNYTDERMDSYVRAAYNTTMFIDAIRTMYVNMQGRGVDVLGMTWTAPAEYLEYRNGGQALMPDHINDFARFLTSSLKYLAANNVHIRYLEMCNEPDGFWDTRVEPGDFALLAARCRALLDEAGLNNVGILGPGVSSLQPNTWAFYEALASNPDGLRALAGFSTHIWDDAYKEDEPIFHVNYWMNNTLSIMRAVDPNKPVVISEFGYNANFLNGREFQGTWDNCYDSLNTDEIKDKHMSQSPMYAARMYGMVLLQLHYNVESALVWEMGDEGWHHMCWGLTDRAGRPKQALASLESIVSRFGSDGRPVRTSYDRSNCVVAAVYNPSLARTVIGLANLLRLESETACIVQLSIEGLKTVEIASATVHTYNNGTVSLSSAQSYTTLIHEDALMYSLDETQRIITLNATLEPHATATLVVEGRARNENPDCVGPCDSPDDSDNCPYYLDPEYPGCCEGWQLAYWQPDDYWYCYEDFAKER